MGISVPLVTPPPAAAEKYITCLPLSGFVDTTVLEYLSNIVVTNAKVPQLRNSVLKERTSRQKSNWIPEPSQVFFKSCVALQI